MTRKLVLLLTALFALHCAPAHSLGLGNLKLKSSLNQEFEAEIELTNIRGLGVDEILPNLASLDDFKRVGVERSYILTDLRFKIQTKESGKLVVGITSNRPIIEPYLNFIVEVLWPSGRILREYTVLLDPPIFGGQGMEPVTVGRTRATPPVESSRPRQPTRASRTVPVEPRIRSASEPRIRPTSEPQNRPPPQMGEVGEVVGDDYGMTGTGDTLWAIALKIRPDSSVSVQQTMLAIQKYNKKAFLNDNINLLMAGFVLRIPSLREIEEVTADSAVAEVKTQNENWESYKSGEPSIAQLDASSTREDPIEESPGPEGELRLLAADTSEGERAGTGGGGGGDAAASVAALETDLSLALEELDKAQRANTELNVKLDDLAGQMDTADRMIQVKDDEITEMQEQLSQLQDSARPATQPAAETSLWSILRNSGFGVLLVLLIVGIAGVLILMRKRRRDASFEGEGIAEMSPAQETTAMGIGRAGEDEMGAFEEEGDAQTSDVLSEVDIYIAYGRFPQAINFLQSAIETEPDRTDIRIKLLEVFVLTKDVAAFNLQFEDLKALGDVQAIQEATEMQADLDGAQEHAEAAMGETVVSSEPVAPIAGEDEFDFDLDDLDDASESLDLDEELDLDIEIELDEDSDELDLDLDLDLDEDEPVADGAEVEGTVVMTTPIDDLGAEDDGLDLDLGDDDDLGLDLGDFDLDGDDDLGLSLEDGESLDLDIDGDEELSLEDEESLDLGIDDDVELSLEDGESLDLDVDDGAELSLEDGESLDLDAGDDEELSLEEEESLDFELDDGDDAELSLEEEESPDSDLDDGDDAELSLEEEESLDFELDDGDDAELSLEEEEGLDFDLGDSDDAALSLEDDEGLGLDLDADDDAELSLEEEESLDFDLGDGDDAALSLEDDEGLGLDLDADDDAELSLEEESLGLDLDAGDDGELSLEDDDSLSLNLDDDLDLESESSGDTEREDSLDDMATVVVDEGDDGFDLDLDLDGDELDLGMDDDDLDLDLGLEDNNKLDLARAYIDMGDKDGAKSLLEEVLNEGSDTEQQEANQLLERID